MKSISPEENWREEEHTFPVNAQLSDPQVYAENAVTRHDIVLEELHERARSDPDTLGFLVIGSVATRTHTEKSDIDVITILRGGRPSSGINKMVVDGIVVDSLFFTHSVLSQSVSTVPYLLHTLVNSRLLFDREGTIRPLIEEVRGYFAGNPEMEREWNAHFNRSKEVKQRTGCRARDPRGTIIDVWNELEKRYSGGKIRRPFFNSFYLTNPRIFSLLKRFLFH